MGSLYFVTLLYKLIWLRDVIYGVLLTMTQIVIYLHKRHIAQEIDMTYLYLIDLVTKALLQIGDHLLAMFRGDEVDLLVDNQLS